MQLDVPESFDSIDAPWLEAALAEHDPQHPVTVDAVSVEPLGNEVGFLGQLARLHITGSGVPGTMILKLPTDDPGGRAVGSMLSAWPRESRFYADVAPTIADGLVPICFYNGIDIETDRYALLLEDVVGRPEPTLPGASIDAVRSAVDAVAAFQRPWWQADRTFEWMPGFEVPGVGGLESAVRGSLDPFADRYGHLVPAETIGWLRAYAHRMSEFVGEWGRDELTIVHADCRTDNLLFADDRVVIIDWQTALRGPGPMDLSSLVVTALGIEDRRRHEDELIERYAASVGKDLAWVRAGYRSCLLWWMAIFANNLSTIEPGPGGQAIFDATIERVFTAAADHAAGDLLS